MRRLVPVGCWKGMRLVVRVDPLARLENDFPFFAGSALRIVDKGRELVPFRLNEGQLALDGLLEQQRLAGLPQRALILKARQLGFSTYAQGRAIHRCTQVANQAAIVIAHDMDTSKKLFAMGERMYENLPAPIKPDRPSFGTGKHMHFGSRGSPFPDSDYTVSTAGNYQGGRGGTYTFVHASEFAFWPSPEEKLLGIRNAVPKLPDTVLLIESTANGFNMFHDEWERATKGESGYIPFFWPWWLDDGYRLSLTSERARALQNRLGTGPYGGEAEMLLLDPGPAHPVTGQVEPLSLEQLAWRRSVIDDECGGSLHKFNQEYPSSPEEAFLSTGSGVFDQQQTKSVLVRCDITDPRIPDTGKPGPVLGTFQATSYANRLTRTGDTIRTPTSALWVPARGPQANWKMARNVADGNVPRDSAFVIGVDMASGVVVGTTDTSDRDFHCIQVIDHVSRQQVAQHVSRLDPMLLAEQIYLAAIYFNNAWVAIEITGGHGTEPARRLMFDYRYRRMYMRRNHERAKTRPEELLGWNTSSKTKPIIEAGLIEALRLGEDGIQFREVPNEMLSYVRDENGKTGAEPGKHDDALLAYMIAQQVASEMPIPRKQRNRRPAS